jgi:hypothetical protein
MNEENSNFDEENNSEDMSVADIPEQIPVEEKEQPEMSEVSTLANIFFEPGRVFEDLRKKPRFILGGLIIMLVISTFNIMLVEKVGFSKMVETQLEANAQVQQMEPKAKQELIERQSKPMFKYIGYAIAPIFLLIVFLLGGLIYFLGANVFGGEAKFMHGVSVWIYSSFPPAIIFMVANIILLFLKSVDDIDLSQAQRGGLIQANPSFFIDGKEMPVLAALLGSIDVFAIWGWILATIGLKVIAKISTASALSIVILIALLGVAAKVVFALIF